MGPRQQAMSIYERELLDIVYVVQKWGAYLSHAPFTIKIDQKNIKHILEQRLNTLFQHAWVSKLIGFEFDILYKEGNNNKAADALSRKPRAKLLSLVLNTSHKGLLDMTN